MLRAVSKFAQLHMEDRTPPANTRLLQVVVLLPKDIVIMIYSPNKKQIC